MGAVGGKGGFVVNVGSVGLAEIERGEGEKIPVGESKVEAGRSVPYPICSGFYPLLGNC